MKVCLKKQLSVRKYYHVSSLLLQVNILNLLDLIIIEQILNS